MKALAWPTIKTILLSLEIFSSTTSHAFSSVRYNDTIFDHLCLFDYLNIDTLCSSQIHLVWYLSFRSFHSSEAVGSIFRGIVLTPSPQGTFRGRYLKYNDYTINPGDDSRRQDFSSTDRKPWNVLPGHTLHALKCFSNDDADVMSFMIWFCTEGDPGEADEKNLAKAITRAVNE